MDNPILDEKGSGEPGAEKKYKSIHIFLKGRLISRTTQIFFKKNTKTQTCQTQVARRDQI